MIVFSGILISVKKGELLKASVPIRTTAAPANNRVYQAPEQSVRTPVPAVPNTNSNSEGGLPGFLRGGRKESKLDIPPFLKMKSRD